MARKMAQAVKFCMSHKLMNREEERKALMGSRDEKLRMACRAMVRMEGYLRSHPEERE